MTSFYILKLTLKSLDRDMSIKDSTILVLDPNSSLGKICLGEDVVVISSDKVEGSGDWNSLEFQDTANSGQKKETKAIEENMISNEYAVKLCLEHEVKRGNKVVRQELMLALIESFLRMTKGITNFRVGTIIIYPDIDPLLEETEEEAKSNDDWDHLLDFNKMGKSIRKKKWAMENLKLSHQDIGTYSSAGEEERLIIETMAYHDKYKKILDEVWKDKVELDGKIVKEEDEAVKRIKGEALKEKDDPGAFIFPIRLEGQVNENALAYNRSNINTMPYRIYKKLGREDMKKVDRGITMINHTQAKAMGILPNVLCQVGITTLIAKFLILDIPIDHDSSIVVGRGFLRTIRAIFNTPKRLFSTFDGFCHQTFHVARLDFMRNAESDSDDEEDYQIKRNKFRALIYGPKSAPYLKCNDPDERSLAIQTVTNPFRKISVWKKAVSFLSSLPVPLKQVN
ncbi:putative reverse transcriptase domain-containing protein [Tanacetum coccineum]|uniref:Reverse transcriptase domain-containing protein n=1 Tax=Tanacetum coccineum TaxID=301880 RepID=A0ABQ5J8Q9_9ASTR